MKTDKLFWSYLAHFFLEQEIFQTKFVENFTAHIFCSVTIFLKSYRLWDNVEKCYSSGQAADENTIWRMHIACRIPKASNT